MQPFYANALAHAQYELRTLHTCLVWTVCRSTAVLTRVPNILSLATTVTTRRGIASFLGLCPFRPRKLSGMLWSVCKRHSPITRLYIPTVDLGWSLAYGRQCATLLQNSRETPAQWKPSETETLNAPVHLPQHPTSTHRVYGGFSLFVFSQQL